MLIVGSKWDTSYAVEFDLVVCFFRVSGPSSSRVNSCYFPDPAAVLVSVAILRAAAR